MFITKLPKTLFLNFSSFPETIEQSMLASLAIFVIMAFSEQSAGKNILMLTPFSGKVVSSSSPRNFFNAKLGFKNKSSAFPST